jgi:two-component system response regulator YesN
MKFNILKKYRFKSVFIKLIFSFICTSMLSVICLSLLLFYSFRQSSIDDINTMTRLVLSNINNRMTNVLDTSQSIVYQIYKNSNVKRMLYSLDKSVFNTVDVSNYIGEIMLSNPFISSVYIYNGNAVVFKKSNPPELYEEDAVIKNIMLENSNLAIFPRKAMLHNGSNVNLYTLFFAEISSTDEIESAVLINIDAGALYKDIYTEPVKALQNVIVTDIKGKLILNNDMEYFLKDESKEPYMLNILKSDSESGFFNIESNKGELVVNFVKSERQKYIAIAINEYNYFVNRLSRERNVVITFCLIILVLILLVTYITSNWLYNPIRSIFNNIRNMLNISSDTYNSSNDFQIISQTILNVVERINLLEAEKKSSISLHKANYIKGILSPTSPTTEIFREDLEKYKLIESNCHTYRIIVLRVDNFKEFYSINTNQAIEFQLDSIGKLVSEQLENSIASHAIIESNNIAIFVSYSESNAPWLASNLELIMKRAQEVIRQLFNISVTIGISDSTEDIGTIGTLYRQAYDLTNYRLYFGKASLFLKGSFKTEDKDLMAFTRLLDDAVNAAKKGLPDRYESTLREILITCRSIRYEDALKIFCNLAELIMRIPYSLEAKSKIADYFDYDVVHQKIECMEDSNELIDWFKTLFEEVYVTLESINRKNALDMVKKATDYLSLHYSDSLISANSISDKISITPQYFSKIFNEITGTSFPEYLNNLRLEKAKEILLTSSNICINEVYEKVGYNSRNYFTTAFKNKYGVSPSKIRDKL